MSKTIWIWRTPEGGMRVQQVGTKPPGAGDVYEVTGAHNRPGAEALVSLAVMDEPNEETDAQRWLAWRKAKRLVRVVDLKAEVL